MEAPRPTIQERIGLFIGYLSAWVVMTLALTMAGRTLHLGPGFKNPIPYFILAMLIGLTGRQLRKWVSS